MYDELIKKIEKKLIKANLLPMKSQALLSKKILVEKLETVLPWAMEKSNVDFWVTIGREDGKEPILSTLMLWDMPDARGINFIAFHRNEETGEVRKMAFGSRSSEMDGIYENPKMGTETPFETMARLVSEINPKKVAINRSVYDGFCDGLSSSVYDQLVEALGENKEKLVDGEEVSTRWLQRLCQTEKDTLKVMVEATHDIVNYTMTNEFIKVGETSTTDIEWAMRDIINRLGFKYWFGPDVDLQRRGSSVTRMFEETIVAGDLVHCDIGINGNYVQLHTDMQWISYALHEGETEIPEEIAELMTKGNRLQDIVRNNIKIQPTGNDVFLTSIDEGKSEGLKPMIYTHPLGTFGHGAGPRIGRYGAQVYSKGPGERPVEMDTGYALELNVCEDIKIWDNQEVFMYLEEDIYKDENGVHFFDGRQTEIFVLK